MSRVQHALRDAATGTIDVFSGGSRRTLTGPGLAAQLIAAERR